MSEPDTGDLTPLDEIEFDSVGGGKKVACVLILDSSFTMAGEPIEKLNEALRQFKADLSRDIMAKYCVDIAVVSIGVDVRIESRFVPAVDFSPPNLFADGPTEMGKAIDLGLDLVDHRNKFYAKNGNEILRPWAILITDGKPSKADLPVWQRAIKRVHDYEEKNKIVFWAIGVEGADMEVLEQTSPREPLMLPDLNFSELFKWLKTSLGGVSRAGGTGEPPPKWKKN